MSHLYVPLSPVSFAALFFRRFLHRILKSLRVNIIWTGNITHMAPYAKCENKENNYYRNVNKKKAKERRNKEQCKLLNNFRSKTLTSILSENEHEKWSISLHWNGTMCSVEDNANKSNVRLNWICQLIMLLALQLHFSHRKDWTFLTLILAWNAELADFITMLCLLLPPIIKYAKWNTICTRTRQNKLVHDLVIMVSGIHSMLVSSLARRWFFLFCRLPSSPCEEFFLHKYVQFRFGL